MRFIQNKIISAFNMIRLSNLLLGAQGLVFAIWLSSCESVSKPTISNQNRSIEDVYSSLEFDMPRVQVPVFSVNSIDITEFGGIGDGIFKNTEAFEKAIDALANNGGGKLTIPRGVWMTRPIVLKSNINLHLEDGALIVFSTDFDEYPLIKTNFEGLETYRCQSPISGKNLKNIAITGAGIIDGSGQAWRPVKKEKLTAAQWKNLVASGGAVSDDGKIWYPSEESKKGDGRDNFNVPDFEHKEQYENVKDFLRPVMISLVGCSKVLLDGPTFQNSPAWNIHPFMCEDVTIRNLTIRNPWYSQNGDGLDLESCKNVMIYNNSFDVGDDAICFKSGKNEEGRKRGVPTENVIVTNNIVYHGHGGFTVGSEMSGGIRNVHISNCTFIGTDIGLRFKSTRGRGGVVENIYISDIQMFRIPAEAIRFNLFYEGKSPIPDSDQKSEKDEEVEVVSVTEATPSFRNIYMKNINVSGSKTAAFFQGLPEMNLQNIVLQDAVIEAEEGITLIDAADITFKNVQLKLKDDVAMTIYNGNEIVMDGFKVDGQNDPAISIIGSKTHAINFINSSIKKDQVSVEATISDEVTFNKALRENDKRVVY